jgi:hypothetical protein
LIHVVRDKAVTRPLGEKSKRDENNKAMAVSWGFEKFDPWVTFKLLLEGDGLADFTVFNLDEFVIYVSSGMALAEDLQRLLILSLCDEETGRFWNKPRECVSSHASLLRFKEVSYQMAINCMTDGTACTIDGILQDHALLMVKVP